MTTREVIEDVAKAQEAARMLRAHLMKIAGALKDPTPHTNRADLYGAISEVRETLRPATMMLAERQAALYQGSRGSRLDLKQAHIDAAERARLSLLAEVGS